MPNLSRLRVAWNGFTGAPGVSTFYFTETTVSYPLFINLFANLKGHFPNDVTWNIPGGGDTIDPLTGDLVGTWGTAVSNAITGTSGGSYAAPTGVMIKWGTGTIIDGHRLNGKTFMVPAASALFDTGGVVVAADFATINTQLQNHVNSMNGAQVVWHRPIYTKVVGGDPVLKRVGGYSAVTTGSLSRKACVLRSRRD